jgi:polysaccharide biosynthesis transport protein
VIALVRALTDNTIHTSSDVSQKLGGRCIAAIPHMSTKQLQMPSLVSGSQQAITKPLRDIRLALTGTISLDTSIVVGIISTDRQEGRSTVALSVALSYVSAGFKTLLVDADFDNPQLSNDFAAADEIGFMGALTMSNHALMNVLIDNTSGLHIMCAGKSSSQAQRLAALSSETASRNMEQLRRNYDVIILDFAPLKECGDAQAFATSVNCYLYVIEARKTQSSDILLALQDADQVHSLTKGFVLTKAKREGFGWLSAKPSSYSSSKKHAQLETFLSR